MQETAIRPADHGLTYVLPCGPGVARRTYWITLVLERLRRERETRELNARYRERMYGERIPQRADTSANLSGLL